jgi:hypothetical protein
MDLLQIKNLKDYRERLSKHATKHYSLRPLSAITLIAVHHSATKTGSAEAFARYHVSDLGWPGIGYHFVIEKDGTIKWTNNLQTISYHVGNSNKKAIGICLTGDFKEEQPTAKQWESLFNLLKNLLLELNLSYDQAWGHSQFPGYETKACPCIDMVYVRQQLRNKPSVLNPKPLPDQVVLHNYRWMRDILNRFPHTNSGELKVLNPTLPKSVPASTPIKINGDPEIVPEGLLPVIRAIETKGYKVFRDDKKEFNLNIVGIRNPDGTPNHFDDQLVVFWRFGNKWNFKKFKITTDPGLAYLNKPISQYGTAILKEGQYRGAYRLGMHQGKYKALVQAEPLTVIRDFNRDDKLDFSSGKEQTGFFGINIHRASPSGESTFVNKWSAGCQVFANSSQFAEFIKLCENSLLSHTNTFTYTLLNGSDVG